MKIKILALLTVGTGWKLDNRFKAYFCSFWPLGSL